MISGGSLFSCNIFLHAAVEFQGCVPRHRPMAVIDQCVVFLGPARKYVSDVQHDTCQANDVQQHLPGRLST